MAPPFVHFGLGYCDGAECNGMSTALARKDDGLKGFVTAGAVEQSLLACKVFMTLPSKHGTYVAISILPE